MLKLIVIIVIGFYVIRFLNKVLVAIEEIEKEKRKEKIIELRAARKESQIKFKKIADRLKEERG